jgi:cob(I)alamin adenosyltransferase
MARVTTGTGDDGYTGLIGPGRVPKHHPRVELLGTIDEATGALGLARAHSPVPRVREVVPRLQRELYRLMADVATTADRSDFRTEPTAVAGLEELQAELQSDVEIPSAFVIPGATASSAALDLARGIVRRAERQAARLLHEGELTNPEVLRYLNRCSDLLHVLARFDEVSQGVEPQTQG